MDTEKREHILAEARSAFERFGFKKTSIDDVAKRAGVAKGTVYLAVSSKKELYFEVLDRELRAWEAEVLAAVPAALPADQQLMLAAGFAFERLSNRPLLREVFGLETDASLYDMAERLDGLRAGGVKLIRVFLDRGVEQGVFREDLDLDEVASMFLDLQMSALVLHLRKGDDPAQLMAERAPVVFEVLMHGLMRPPPASAAEGDGGTE